MSKNLLESDLKSLLSSTAKKQNFLSGHHPASLAAPLVALAVADLVKRKTGTDVLHGFIGADTQVEVDQIEMPDLSSTGKPSNGFYYRKIYESCRNCAAGDLKRPANMLTWMFEPSPP